MTYMSYPQPSQPAPGFEQPLPQPNPQVDNTGKYDGFAIACFILAFIPGLITFVLSLIFGIISFGRIRRTNAKGGTLMALGLGINTLTNIIGLVVFSILLSTIGNTGSLDGTDTSGKVTNQAYVLSVNEDATTTVLEIVSAGNDNPNIDLNKMPVLKHDNDVVKISYTRNKVLTLKAYSTSFGDPKTDYITWDAEDPETLVVHGAYTQFRTALDTRTTLKHTYDAGAPVT